MPFSQDWSADVHRILATACEAAGVRAVRGDDLFSPTDILEDIWQGLNAADFVIADITGRNPNVLYELGIAHTLAKPVLILSKEAADIPIDLATRRVILYGQKTDAWREELARMIQEAIAKVVEDYGLESRISKTEIDRPVRLTQKTSVR
jgi:nucleoside 2-deoxyribosyltransferase